MCCPTCENKTGLGQGHCELCGAGLSSNDNLALREVPMVGFVHGIRLGFQNYFRFNGRSRRSEYWWWTLFSTLCLPLTMIPLLGFLLGIVLWIPRISVTTRRLHDVGKSGWWQLWLVLLALVPWIVVIASQGTNSLVGPILIAPLALDAGLAIMFVVWLTRKGDEGPNKYGPDPRQTPRNRL